MYIITRAISTTSASQKSSFQNGYFDTILQLQSSNSKQLKGMFALKGAFNAYS